MKEKIRNSNGITILTLSITVIVMIILTGVTAYTLSSDSSIFKSEEEVEQGFYNDITGTNQIIDGYDNEWASVINSGLNTDDQFEGYLRKIRAENEGLTIGSVVNYTSPINTYNLLANYSGYIEDQELSNNEDKYRIETWQVLNINEDGTVDLIAETPTKGKVTIVGERGYNNAVKIFNDACSVLYSNGSKVSARNIKIEDIEDKLTNTINRYDVQGTKISETTGIGIDYPTQYANEYMSVVEDVVKNDGLNVSEQEEFIEIGNIKNSTSIQPYRSAYKTVIKRNILKDSRYYSIINNDSYWIASRCVTSNEDTIIFGINNVSNNTLTYKQLTILADDSTAKPECSDSLRPIITVRKTNIVESNGNWVIE